MYQQTKPYTNHKCTNKHRFTTGRRLLEEVKRHPKVAKIEYPLIEGIVGEKTYTIEEVFSKVEEKLNKHYGTNHKLKY